MTYKDHRDTIHKDLQLDEIFFFQSKRDLQKKSHFTFLSLVQILVYDPESFKNGFSNVNLRDNKRIE